MNQHTINNNPSRVVAYIAYHAQSLAGAERSLLSLMNAICDYGFVPILICDEACPLTRESANMGIKTYILPVKSYVYLASVVDTKAKMMYPIKRIYNTLLHSKMKRILLKEHVELVHLNSSVVCYEWATVARKLKIPYVWHFREYMWDDHKHVVLGKKYFRSLVHHAASRIAISKSVKNYWEDETKTDFKVVYNGLEINGKIRRNNILENKDIKCIITGRVVEGKGQLDAVKAIRELHRRGYYNIKLFIVGFRGNGAYEDTIKEYVMNSALLDDIHLIDFTDSIDKYVRDMDIGLVCSKAEAFGRVTIEHNLSGLLVIGSNSGGTPELISHMKTGLLYEQGNPISLADELEWVIGNKSQAKEIAEQGQVNARMFFSIERTACGVVDVYDSILN